jgi:hypothetical protein
MTDRDLKQLADRLSKLFPSLSIAAFGSELTIQQHRPKDFLTYEETPYDRRQIRLWWGLVYTITFLRPEFGERTCDRHYIHYTGGQEFERLVTAIKETWPDLKPRN